MPVLRWSSLLLVLLLGCGSRGGQGQGTDERPTYSITLKVAEDLAEIPKYTEKKDWDGALAKLGRIAEREYLNPYERAMLFRVRSGIYFAKTGGMAGGDELAAIVSNLEQAVAFDAMPMQEQLAAEYELGEAYFVSERFAEAADTFAKWLKRAESPKPLNYYMIASAYAQAKRFQEALPFAKQAVEKAAKPEEPWLALLVSIHYELKQETEVAAVLEQLVKAFPKKEHLLQLSATYSELGNHGKALAALEAAHAKGMLIEEKEFIALATLYLKTDAAAKGAAVLEAELTSGKVAKSPAAYELLAACYLAAKDIERASAALKEAGDETSSGELHLELGRAELARSQWERAREAFSQAIQRGGLKSPGEAQLLLGVAHYHAKSKAAALASLGEAKKHPQTEKCAEQWIAAVRAGKTGPATCGKEPAAGGK